MLLLHSRKLLSFLLALPNVCHCTPNSVCKPLPGETNWPGATAWEALNSSVSGRLLATIPPGSVCHPELVQYDFSACAVLPSQWTNGTFVALNPVTSDYNDVTCLPAPNTTCSAAGYPTYVIQASCPRDVQAGVEFARDTGVRLIVKGTGHDYPGRSSGGGSLSIHTSGMRGLFLNRSDSRAQSYGGIGCLKINAGERFGDVYAFAAANNVTAIGGADPGVGVGGWLTAGGHGPLTAKYGLGADQVLEMEVVTPDGIYRTIDVDRDADLFWAMRGGGGSTFAVMTSVTVVAYPPVNMAEYLYAYNTTANSDTFWSMVACFHSQIPTLSEAGLMGYYFANPDSPTESASSMQGKLYGIWLAPGKSAEEVQNIIAPMEKVLLGSQWAEPVVGGGYAVGNLTFSTRWASNQPEVVGTSGRLGSRLLDRAALEDDEQRLKDALRTSTPPPWMLLGHVVAGPGTRLPAGGASARNNSALEAWRHAYTHVVLPRSWPSEDLARKDDICRDLRTNRTGALRKLAPNTGAYRNEADPTEVTWQPTFYGRSYPRLLEIKQRWDPDGVFWCKSCVGSELWYAKGDEGIENGVGQDPIRLCKNE